MLVLSHRSQFFHSRRLFSSHAANVGISELRACFVPTELHAEVKALVAEWLAQRTRKD